jgi:hypothetical protein
MAFTDEIIRWTANLADGTVVALCSFGGNSGDTSTTETILAAMSNGAVVKLVVSWPNFPAMLPTTFSEVARWTSANPIYDMKKGSTFVIISQPNKIVKIDFATMATLATVNSLTAVPIIAVDSNDFVYLTDASLVLTPAVETEPAINITTFSAELVGLLANDGGEDCNCGFQWGPTIAYGNTTPTTSQTTGFTFDQIITGLTPGISYHFRALAMNSAGTAYGSDLTFSTLPLGLKMAYPVKRRLT